MITTVTLNPAIDREYFVSENRPGHHQYVYDDDMIRVSPGGRGLRSAINFKQLGYEDVQNIGFVGGRQGLFFEKMVQHYNITTNYIYTDNEIRNNIFIIGTEQVTYTRFSDYTYSVARQDVDQLIKRFKRGIVDSTFIMISGSIPAGVDFDIYRELIQISHAAGKDIYLNAGGEVMERALIEKPLVVVPYFKHHHTFLDRPMVELEDFIWAGKTILEHGAEHVILPFHENRLAFLRDEIYMLSPTESKVKNWHGASEAYNSAFFDYVFQKGFNFLEANQYASAAALAVAEKNDIIIESRAEIESKLHNIVMKKVEV